LTRPRPTSHHKLPPDVAQTRAILNAPGKTGTIDAIFNESATNTLAALQRADRRDQPVRRDAQFDWAHKFYHTKNWFAIAARHFLDELAVGQDAIEFHLFTNCVFRTGFTNLQFVGLASLAHGVKDHLSEKMITSIQTTRPHLASLKSRSWKDVADSTDPWPR
jgi:hypothetical protein